MNSIDHPMDLLERLQELFAGTGLHLLGLDDAFAFVQGQTPGEYAQWSTFFQRLYRYHDFCALELGEVTSEGGAGVAHLLVECRRNETLSGAYRLVAMAIDASDPDNAKAVFNPTPLQDELDLVAGGMAVLFWAFATRKQRQAFLDKAASESLDSEKTAALLVAPPLEILEPMGELAAAIEDLAAESPPKASDFKRPIYPPMHPAASYQEPASEELIGDIVSLL